MISDRLLGGSSKKYESQQEILPPNSQLFPVGIYRDRDRDKYACIDEYHVQRHRIPLAMCGSQELPVTKDFLYIQNLWCQS